MTELHKLEDMRRILKERFRVNHDLPGVFFDPNAIMDDVAEKTAIENHTKTLWNFMLTKEDFEFKSIQDFSIELETCQNKSAEDTVKLESKTNELMGKY